MRIEVKGRNLQVTDELREIVARRFEKVDKQVSELATLEVELSEEKNPSISACHIAEATIWTKGPTLRAKERSSDMRASIDLLTDKLERQVTRYREKRRRRHREHDGHGVDAHGPTATDEEGGPVIVKTKQFSVKPMSAEEAALQLELVGHDFFVFRNAETDTINVVYRRRDGDYGLIEPS